MFKDVLKHIQAFKKSKQKMQKPSMKMPKMPKMPKLGTMGVKGHGYGIEKVPKFSKPGKISKPAKIEKIKGGAFVKSPGIVHTTPLHKIGKGLKY